MTALFTGCTPEIASADDGTILALGDAARAAAGRHASIHHLRGRTYAGFGDAHLHLQGMAENAMGVDLAGAPSRRAVLQRVEAAARRLPHERWVLGGGWCNDDWNDDARLLTRNELDVAGGGRPVLLIRKDGHSTCLSTRALEISGLSDRTDLAGGVVDRDAAGQPTGIVRERASDLARSIIPAPRDAEFDSALLSVLRRLAALGLTSVHTMDGRALFRSLQRLHLRSRLPLRVTWNLPVDHLADAEALGVTSGFGDSWLRIWGVKVFLDGSLGSHTAEMLDGNGIVVTPQPELLDIVRRCAAARLNVCMHAIGDAAVRRALDAVESVQTGWSRWRPRIEHAQCVDPADVPRFRRLRVVASMQPVHAVSDRAVADREWRDRTAHAYAWGALHAAGATLAFGSDAPVEDPSPLAGVDAATTWRSRARWHQELALSRAAAIRAYTSGVAYAAGMERVTGSLRRGRQCDLTVVDDDEVVATVTGGRLAALNGRFVQPRSD